MACSTTFCISEITSEAISVFKQSWKQYVPFSIAGMCIMMLIALIPVAGLIVIQPLFMIFGAVLISFTSVVSDHDSHTRTMTEVISFVRSHVGRIIPLAILYLIIGLLASIVFVVPAFGLIIGLPVHLLINSATILAVCHLLNDPTARTGQLWERAIESIRAIGYWKTIGFAFVAAMVGASGALVVGIGIIVTMPITFIMWTLLYEQLELGVQNKPIPKPEHSTSSAQSDNEIFKAINEGKLKL
jgi:hypothetical protein